MERSDASTLDHHLHFGEDNYVAVSDFASSVSIHLRKFRKNSSGSLFPTKKGVSFSPDLCFSLAKEMGDLPLPSKTEKSVIVRDSLFIST
ncbi:hypothetical protein AVEN_133460-1 [Araneus ventricosus]|uniref:Transcriptional coactivator p15 (PC4) C-terminal domain-containing protein n=1 Tax=Araneus ventricosus TaxID=182803 RepID=A0A4Y2H9F3_ARAVE|nr:hypothetical protein AVEN_133460-1 [Araneus ventricosus]